MVHRYRTKVRYRKWSTQDMFNAIGAVKSKVMSYKAAALYFNVPHTTLIYKTRQAETQLNIPRHIKSGKLSTNFATADEEKLVDFLTEMDKRCFGLTPMELRTITFQYAELHGIPHRFNKITGMASPDWYQNFTKRHPQFSADSLQSKLATSPYGINEINMNNFFDQLTDLLMKYNFPPNCIYNVHETRITTSFSIISQSSKVASEQEINVISSGEMGKTVTSVFCCNADGTFIPPLIIFPRTRYNSVLQNGCSRDTLVVYQSSGWMQADIFCPVWFNHFKKYSKPTEENPVLLIIDGHSTLVLNVNFITTAQESNVHILCIPPYTSNEVQPLNSLFMKSFKSCYSQKYLSWECDHPREHLSLRHVPEIFGQAYLAAATPHNAKEGFAASGIHPLNRHLFTDQKVVLADTSDNQPMDYDTKELDEPADDTKHVLKPNLTTSPATSRYRDNSFIMPSTSTQAVCSAPNSPQPPTEYSNKESNHGLLFLAAQYDDRIEYCQTTDMKTVKKESSPYIVELQNNEFNVPTNNLMVTSNMVNGQDILLAHLVKAIGVQQMATIACIICGGSFGNSAAHEHWIQCEKCNHIAHEKCWPISTRRRSYLCQACI